MDGMPNRDDPVVIIGGDAISALRQIPGESVQCCVTSPPYWSLRDYGVEGQLGLESTPDAYIDKLVDVFREVWRVLHPSGTLFVNVGDSYCSTDKWGGGGSNTGKHRVSDGKCPSWAVRKKKQPIDGLKPKDLIGVPWMLAFALRADGWYLRSDIPWVKRSPMPESAADRPSKALEYVFMLAKNDKYFFDMDAVRREFAESTIPRQSRGNSTKSKNASGAPGQAVNSLHRPRLNGETYKFANSGRSMRNTDPWFQSIEPPPRLVGIGDELVGIDVTNSGIRDAHFAAYPEALIEPFVLAGTSAKGCCPACRSPWRRVTERKKLKRRRPNDYTKRTGEEGTGNSCANSVAGVSVETIGWEPTCKCGIADPVPCIVLDPFLGSGTTAIVATKLDRHAIGIELNPEYVEIAKRRLANPVGVNGLFGPSEIAVRQAELFEDLASEDRKGDREVADDPRVP